MSNEIKFEIVGLYPTYGTTKTKIVYSAHVFLFNEAYTLQIDIRGLAIHLDINHPENDRVCDLLKYTFDYEENKIVHFPVVSSTQADLFPSIKKALIKEGRNQLKNFVYPKDFPKSFKEYLKKIAKPKKEEQNAYPKKNNFVSNKPKSFVKKPAPNFNKYNDYRKK